MFESIKNAWKIADLKKKLLFTLMIIVLYRLGAVLPVPYVNQALLEGSLLATGGGFFENIPRMLKDGQGVCIDVKSFPRPEIFNLIMETGQIPEKEMYNVFNMGIGFMLAVSENDVEDS